MDVETMAAEIGGRLRDEAIRRGRSTTSATSEVPAGKAQAPDGALARLFHARALLHSPKGGAPANPEQTLHQSLAEDASEVPTLK